MCIDMLSILFCFLLSLCAAATSLSSSSAAGTGLKDVVYKTTTSTINLCATTSSDSPISVKNALELRSVNTIKSSTTYTSTITSFRTTTVPAVVVATAFKDSSVTNFEDSSVADFKPTTTISQTYTSRRTTTVADANTVYTDELGNVYEPTATVTLFSTVYGDDFGNTLEPTATITLYRTSYRLCPSINAVATIYEPSYVVPYTTITRTWTLRSTITTLKAITVSSTSVELQATTIPQHSAQKALVPRSVASSMTSKPACPTDLSSGNFQFPHLIVPISSSTPNISYGNSFTAYISSINSTLYSFDIPATYTGTCALLFLFPFGSDLDPSAGKYYYSGMEQVIYQNGGLNFALLDGIATNSTSFANTPAMKEEYGKVQILPGNKYMVAKFECAGGRTVTYKGSSVNMTELDYFQSSASQPIGLYVVPCA